MDVIMLAGGKGSRMDDDLPKALVQTKGKSIIEHQFDYLSNFGNIGKVILSLGHRADEIKEYLKGKSKNLDIHYSIENEPLGTGGGIKKALELSSSEQVLVLNGDNLTNIDLNELSNLGGNAICVAKRRSPYGRVTENDEGYAEFEEKPIMNDWTSCGWYYFSKSDIMGVLPEKGSLEYDAIPKIKMRLFKHQGYCHSLNSKKDIGEFEKSK